MNPFESPSFETQENTAKHDSELLASADQFLGDEKKLVNDEQLHSALDSAAHYKTNLKESLSNVENKSVVQYDKYKKSFLIDGDKVTAGQIIASRHLGKEIALPESLEQSGDGKKLIKNYLAYKTADVLSNELNASLANTLSEKTRREDMLKSKAYAEIRDRSNIESKQLGVIAEKIMIGFAETIAIDRPDLGLKVTAGNAYQDVEFKIDFILETTQKKRGVGIDARDLGDEHKSIGIQFTINTAKEGSKLAQIQKAKNKGIHVDDIMYVAIDQPLLRQALNEWEKNGKPIAGPLEYLPKTVKTKAIQELFQNVLTPEQQESLMKSFT